MNTTKHSKAAVTQPNEIEQAVTRLREDLSASIPDTKNMPNYRRQKMEDIRTVIDALAAERKRCAELAKDKERLDWLEKARCTPFDASPMLDVDPEFQPPARVTRKSIDDAMNGEVLS